MDNPWAIVAIMMSNATRSIAVATGGLMLAGVAAAPSALAYPPGNKVEVFTNKANYNANATVRVKATQVQRGCKVRFRIAGFKFERNKVVSSSSSRVFANLRGPSNPGRYRVIVTTFGSGCTTETARSWIRV